VKSLDRFLQRWRIRVARPFVPPGARVLDIGCADAALLRHVPHIGEYVGIDPDLDHTSHNGRVALVHGRFPGDLPDERPFDTIAMLAVLEHVPTERLAALAADCARFLKPGGRLIATVPSRCVDRVVGALAVARVLDGMSLDEHHGFDAGRTPSVFAAAGLKLIASRGFQLGLNNLFVFERATDATP
jgi:2-polyprenyl-3-methyl-5-hydroxy-6-metoxy-1,4-benzoquinol methylase